MASGWTTYLLASVSIILLPTIFGVCFIVFDSEIGSFFAQEQPSYKQAIALALAASWMTFAAGYIVQNVPLKMRIARYSRVEYKLLELGLVTKDQIINYHSSFSWGTYAGLGCSTVMLVTTLIMQMDVSAGGQALVLQPWSEVQSNSGTQMQNVSALYVISSISLCLLLVSSIVMAAVDVVHTNSLSPLLPPSKRFALVNFTIVLAGAAFVMQISAVNIFLSLVNTWLTVFGAAVSIVIYVVLISRRNVRLAAVLEEFKIDETVLSGAPTTNAQEAN